MLAIVAFVLPLCLDSFAVAAALGTRRPGRADRWRLAGLFVLGEAGMPLVGLAIGAPLARLIGSGADYLAAAVLVGVGAWMLLGDRDDGDEAEAGRLLGARGLALVAVVLSVSADELAIGFTLGLARLPVLPVVLAIAVQTLVASQLGLALGARIGAAWRERAERLAGLLLVLLGIGLAIHRATG